MLMVDWLAANYIEVLGAALSVFYLILSIRQSIYLWPVGMLSALMYIVVFFQSKFYADMGLNVYYFVISIYGWINWSGTTRESSEELPVTRTGKGRGFLLLAVVFILYFLLGYLLQHFTDSPVPYWDALTTAGSIVATWMLTKKLLEHWIIWVVVDLISMGLYIYRGLYPTAVLFAVYTTMAVVGYVRWRRDFLQGRGQLVS